MLYNVQLYIQYYMYSVICRPFSLWGGPGPRFEPGTDTLQAGTLTTIDQHASLIILASKENSEKCIQYSRIFCLATCWPLMHSYSQQY